MRKIAVTTCEGVMQNWPLCLLQNRGSESLGSPAPETEAEASHPGSARVSGDFLHIYVQCSNHGFRKLYIMLHIKLYQVEKCSPQVRL
jgi:hypothetical protein